MDVFRRNHLVCYYNYDVWELIEMTTTMTATKTKIRSRSLSHSLNSEE